MRIAIVAPSSVPFVLGGAENLWLGLQRYINEETYHSCELFKIQSPESDLISLLESYNKFAKLDLSGFDQVITGKYPAWMIEHPNHKIYMLHKLRGLYDTYHFVGELENFIWPTKLEDSKIKKYIEELGTLKNHTNKYIQEFLAAVIESLKSGEIDAVSAKFPGPFARLLIHALDNFAMHPSRIKGYFSISKTVKNRVDYFPSDLNVNVLYPPPRLNGFKCLAQDYFFTTSRLDGPKRIDLIIESMKYVKHNVQLLIAGTGPKETDLKQLAKHDKRIVFLGNLQDSELVESYANSLAIIFVPYDEDYGLVTIEAMRSSKPVITATDSGGVNEFVDNNKTGLSVSPNSKSIGAAINYLFENKVTAKEMGKEAGKRVTNIKWDRVVKYLCQIDSEIKNKKKKMVVLVTFPVYPPRGGGQSRIYHLYKEFSKEYDIDILSLGETGSDSTYCISENFHEFRIGKSEEHQFEENKISHEIGWVPVTDIAAAKLINLTPKYIDKLKALSYSADVIVACHPYLIHAILENVKNCEIWFEAQDVEIDIKRSILPDNDYSHQLLELVKHAESTAWQAANLVYACSSNDLLKLKKLYGQTNAKLLEIPNGYSPGEVKFISNDTKIELKKVLGLDKTPTVIFIGSWHGPNIEAVNLIIDLAAHLPSVIFMIVGSVGYFYREKSLPENIKILGAVDDDEKLVVLGAADLAINPMISGSGSNLKMLDYMASGVPVISTTFGARGLDIVPDTHYVCSDFNEFNHAIFKFFIVINSDNINKIINSARNIAESKYSWSIIGENALKEICNAK